MHLKKLRSRWLKMKTDEKIIKYLNGELIEEDKISFEADLSNSPHLRNEYELFLKLEQNIKLSKEVRLNQNYLNTILPEFRSKSYSNNSVVFRNKIGYSFAVVIALLVSFLIFKNIYLENSEISSIQSFTESLNENQKIEILENLNGDNEEYVLASNNVTNIELTNMLQAELKINNEIAEVYDINYSELVDDLSQAEADKIYKEILSKNFSKEVN
jgi:hypothetical protein